MAPAATLGINILKWNDPSPAETKENKLETLITLHRTLKFFNHSYTDSFTYLQVWHNCKSDLIPNQLETFNISPD